MSNFTGWKKTSTGWKAVDVPKAAPSRDMTAEAWNRLLEIEAAVLANASILAEQARRKLGTEPRPLPRNPDEQRRFAEAQRRAIANGGGAA